MSKKIMSSACRAVLDEAKMLCSKDWCEELSRESDECYESEKKASKRRKTMEMIKKNGNKPLDMATVRSITNLASAEASRKKKDYKLSWLLCRCNRLVHVMSMLEDELLSAVQIAETVQERGERQEISDVPSKQAEMSGPQNDVNISPESIILQSPLATNSDMLFDEELLQACSAETSLESWVMEKEQWDCMQLPESIHEQLTGNFSESEAVCTNTSETFGDPGSSTEELPALNANFEDLRETSFRDTG